ncbi:MAG: serine/threonine protein kinase, partial [Deltaproteobacteria bacterium]|nr:serine/threonine protein kinase [Deltaproteobacteria bacterium]
MRYVCPECDRVFPEKLPACPADGALLLGVQDAAPDPLVGTTLDARFRVDRLLGQGGMGAVYAGEQVSVGRTVAIKVIRGDAGRDAEVVKRFHREARVISQLAHGNVVQLIDFGQTEQGLLYLAMELVAGQSLADEIAKGPMALQRAANIVGQVCDALAAAHALGVVHRDLKPDNILLTSQPGAADVVKILDFGIAKVAKRADEGTALTQTGAIIGTPQYMSPEQIDASGQVGPATDLYALAVIAFELLAGRPPFEDKESIALLIKHLRDRPPLLREVAANSQLPEAVETFVQKNLAKDPLQRSASALAFKQEFAKAIAPVVHPAEPPLNLPDGGRAATHHDTLHGQVTTDAVGAPIARQTALGQQSAARISGLAEAETVPEPAATLVQPAPTRQVQQPTVAEPPAAPTVVTPSPPAPPRASPAAPQGGVPKWAFGIAFVLLAAAAAVVATWAARPKPTEEAPPAAAMPPAAPVSA